MTAQELQFFDTVAPHWDSRDYLSTPAKISAIMQLGGVQPGQRVLDLGTGTGVLLPYIARAVGAEGAITAVDLSTRMLELARQKCSGLSPAPRFLNLDFELQSIPGRYDHITMYCVYPHMERPLETLRTLRERNLRPGGNILIAFPSSAERINAIHRHKDVEADLLPPPQALAERLSTHGLEARVLSDTPDLYLVSLGGAASKLR